jgi:hypothetical protein
MLTRWLGIIALTTLAACASTVDNSNFQTRFDQALDHKFEWESLGIPPVDAAMVYVVACGVEIQQVMSNNKDRLDFRVIDKYEDALQNELEAMGVTKDTEATKQQERQAASAVRASMTPEDRSALDAQISAVEKFSKAFKKGLAEAGEKFVEETGKAVLTLAMVKDILGDKATTAAAKALGGFKALQAASQIDDAVAMIQQLLDTEAVVDYLDVQFKARAATGKSADV